MAASDLNLPGTDCRRWLVPSFRDWNIEDCLAYIRVPVLLIWCAGDRYASFNQVDAAREACTCPLEIVVLENAVHWPFREQPKDTLRAVGKFIERLMVTHGETVQSA